MVKEEKNEHINILEVRSKGDKNTNDKWGRRKCRNERGAKIKNERTQNREMEIKEMQRRRDDGKEYGRGK